MPSSKLIMFDYPSLNKNTFPMLIGRMYLASWCDRYEYIEIMVANSKSSHAYSWEPSYKNSNDVDR